MDGAGIEGDVGLEVSSGDARGPGRGGERVFELSLSQPEAPKNWPELHRTTVNIWPPEPQDTTLAAPIPIGPPDGAMFDSYPRRITCKWEPSAGAVSYLLEWDYMDQGAWHAESQGIPGAAYVVNGTELTFGFRSAQAGRWRVWPVNDKGQRGNASEWRVFRYLQ